MTVKTTVESRQTMMTNGQMGVKEAISSTTGRRIQYSQGSIQPLSGYDNHTLTEKNIDLGKIFDFLDI